MDFHSIQAEKAKAMIRYRRLRHVARIWRLIEFLIVLTFISWSSTRLPDAVKIAVKFSVNFSSHIYESLYNPLVNFVLFNAIIVVLFLLSRQNYSASDGAGAGDEDLQLVVFTESDFELPSPAPSPEAEENNAVVVERDEGEAVIEAIEVAKRQIRKFERTQSVSLKRELREKSRRELRRWETERAISVINRVDSSNQRAVSVIDRVDTLSSEEFQRTVEEFIAQRQRFFVAQRLAERQQQPVENLGF